YAYGSLPVLVTKAVATAMEKLSGTEWTSFSNHLHKVGRFLSALFDTGTAALVFLIARRTFDELAGLLAASMFSFAPMTIQLAHFFTTDSWLTFFVSLTLLMACRAA